MTQTANATIEVTIEQMLEVLQIEGDQVFAQTGDYSTGFWKHQLCVDLEELQRSNLEAAFAVIEDVHDTAGMSMREYHGIDYYATLPDGAVGASIAAFCLDIWNRREKLTVGFDTEWSGDWKAAWTYNEDDYSVEEAEEYWKSKFREEVESQINNAEVYDLHFSENIPFVMEAIQEGINNLENPTVSDIEKLLHETYESDTNVFFTHYAEAAEKILERINA